ncbi:unnamed protein product [Ectocarpus sp. 13 AM-2016]
MAERWRDFGDHLPQRYFPCTRKGMRGQPAMATEGPLSRSSAARTLLLVFAVTTQVLQHAGATTTSSSNCGLDDCLADDVCSACVAGAVAEDAVEEYTECLSTTESGTTDLSAVISAVACCQDAISDNDCSENDDFVSFHECTRSLASLEMDGQDECTASVAAAAVVRTRAPRRPRPRPLQLLPPQQAYRPAHQWRRWTRHHLLPRWTRRRLLPCQSTSAQVMSLRVTTHTRASRNDATTTRTVPRAFSRATASKPSTRIASPLWRPTLIPVPPKAPSVTRSLQSFAATTSCPTRTAWQPTSTWSSWGARWSSGAARRTTI